MFRWRRANSSAPAPAAARPRLRFETWPAALYAIGDVHGCLSELRTLLERIISDDTVAIPGEHWIVMLGDYVDRGPDSAGVVDLLCQWPYAGLRLLCLGGNHDAMFQGVIEDPSRYEQWADLGGDATLRSYDIDPVLFRRASSSGRANMLARQVPRHHRDLLASLPAMVELPGAVFVHAGIRAGTALRDQADQDLLWMRQAEGDVTDHGMLVVHGHTPVPAPLVLGSRICIDTGAFASGILSAVRLTGPAAAPVFLDSRRLQP